uniref:Uncharacterized protein n=1 Tax=Loa loa TaxID=7209 RepID=A0A1I7VH26_LOALO
MAYIKGDYCSFVSIRNISDTPERAWSPPYPRLETSKGKRCPTVLTRSFPLVILTTADRHITSLPLTSLSILPVRKVFLKQSAFNNTSS